MRRLDSGHISGLLPNAAPSLNYIGGSIYLEVHTGCLKKSESGGIPGLVVYLVECQNGASKTQIVNCSWWLHIHYTCQLISADICINLCISGDSCGEN